MPNQIGSFRLYTQNGYAGDLVDSGPRVVQTGILVGDPAGFGLALKRSSDVNVDRGVELGGAVNVFAISQREYNHEADVRPAKTGVAGTWAYQETQSVSIIRQGYVYILLTSDVAAGAPLFTEADTGTFGGTGTLECQNVFADEKGLAGDVIKARIDIVTTVVAPAPE